ncbi:PREDICTED: CD180 antigen [Chlamydotis macqueenii]|uniref:CD180 antigen n=1 Tax=Chlamydotis macqueenii TaxID=187382 RepID=UPI000529B369|nr:PREDICTED: CD180 antigen [Chlamydotis macqueenii]
MASDLYLLIFTSLACMGCEASWAAEPMCAEITVSKSYSCEGLGLRKIPEKLPITTEILDFSFNVLPSLQNSTFSELKSLLYLDLTRCQINWVYDGAFHSNKQLKTIVLTGNLLLFLSDTAFAGPQSLKQLVLTQTGITSMSFIPMTNLDSLDTLILGSNHISSLQLPPNFPTKNLKYLDFQMNNIRAITAEDVRILQKTSNITVIFKGNDILYIEPRAFQSHFYKLDFGGCTDIPVVLAGIQNSTVQTLWLGTFHNMEKKSFISPDVLQGLCNISVKNLYLQLQHFRNLNATTFQCLTKLQKLDLTQTHISALPPGISGMDSLTELVLNANSFEHLCHTRSAAFPSLTHLHIKGNLQVLQLGSGCLEKLAKLQHLDLSKSHIESFGCCNEALSGLSSLQHLNLSHNIKLHPQDVLFKDGANLELLDLAFTPLYINNSQGPFRNLHLLQVLNISSSHINTSIQHLFQGLENLMLLDLSQNNFESGILPKDKLFQQLHNLEVLILSSCELTAIGDQAFHSLQKLRHVDLSHNKLTAFSTDAFSNLNSIYLNFAHNRIRIVPQDKLASLAGHCVINLSYNPLDCTCSNIGLISWYRQNLDKIEDPEGTRCSEPKSLAGAQLATISLSCGLNTVGIIVVVLAILCCSAIFIWGARYFKQNYQQI